MDLKQTALYAKGWYQKNDLFEDLKKTFKADGYQPSFKSDIIQIMVNEITPVICKDIKSFTFDLLSDLHPLNTWKVGYNTQGSINYNFEDAVIHLFLSRLRSMDKDQIGDVEPDYNILPKSTTR